MKLKTNVGTVKELRFKIKPVWHILTKFIFDNNYIDT